MDFTYQPGDDESDEEENDFIAEQARMAQAKFGNNAAKQQVISGND